MTDTPDILTPEQAAEIVRASECACCGVLNKSLEICRALLAARDQTIAELETRVRELEAAAKAALMELEDSGKWETSYKRMISLDGMIDRARSALSPPPPPEIPATPITQAEIDVGVEEMSAGKATFYEAVPPSDARGWVRVEDGYPEVDEVEVLVGRASWTGGEWRSLGVHGWMRCYGVTNWRPLPEPPEPAAARKGEGGVA